ncbi:glycosyltransferase family 2 protein [uncultured Alsobacter sp.]|uniref:glycosyltransferase family 2 protein n=1 Tax=uncultured Alsobacter sp. TaxID=1748258 RepID=UPI0025DF9889|nr:glycosyltransferase family 2 protein [uncultured Alsobacter sp.]
MVETTSSAPSAKLKVVVPAGSQFTVVIPLFNKANFIGRAIASVKLQSSSDFRAVIIDDGSTDGSGDRALHAIGGDPRFELIRQDNAGVSSARNAGVLAARTDWVAFLDADDEWQPGFLAAIADVIDGSADLTMVSTAYVEDHPTDPVVNDWGYGTNGYVAFDYDFFGLWASYGGPPVWSSAVAVRRDAILSTGGFPVGISLGEDILCWMALLNTGRRAFIARLLATSHGDDSGSLTRAPSPRSVASHQHLVDAVARLEHPAAAAVRKHVNTSHCYMLMRTGDSSLLLRHLRTHFASVPLRTWIRSLLFAIGAERQRLFSRRPKAAPNRNA